jgi:putative intracellular protease/amidase
VNFSKRKKTYRFSNAEEEAAVGLTDVVPFFIRIYKENGASYSSIEDWHPYAVQDGLLITGQNPASSKLVENYYTN